MAEESIDTKVALLKQRFDDFDKLKVPQRLAKAEFNIWKVAFGFQMLGIVAGILLKKYL